MLKLEPHEIDTLLDALDELERQRMGNLPNLERMTKILPEARPDEAHQAYREFRQDLLKQTNRLQKDKRLLREQVTLLKAKIIQYQQSEAASKVLDDAGDQ